MGSRSCSRLCPATEAEDSSIFCCHAKWFSRWMMIWGFGTKSIRSNPACFAVFILTSSQLIYSNRCGSPRAWAMNHPLVLAPRCLFAAARKHQSVNCSRYARQMLVCCRQSEASTRPVPAYIYSSWRWKFKITSQAKLLYPWLASARIDRPAERSLTCPCFSSLS